MTTDSEMIEQMQLIQDQLVSEEPQQEVVYATIDDSWMNRTMLEEILMTQSNSGHVERMNTLVKKWIEALGGEWFEDSGNIYATKGQAETYPCMVAHTDTVHQIVKNKAYDIGEAEGKLFAYDPRTRQYRGIGGDDKVGIYIALEAFDYFPNIKVAFFRDEEIGCVGSRKAVMPFFDDVGFVLQCDRNGYGDFINDIYGYELFGDEFKDAISPILTKFNFKTHGGAMTDVLQLKKLGLNVAAANMSCGYYNAHTSREFIDIADMKYTMLMCFDIIATLGSTRFEHKGKDRWENYTQGYWTEWDDSDDYERRIINGRAVRIYNPLSRTAATKFTAYDAEYVCRTCGREIFWIDDDGTGECWQCEVAEEQRLRTQRTSSTTAATVADIINGFHA